MNIKVMYESVDGFTATQSFTDLAEAQKHAQNWIGRFPEFGRGYAISGDGIGKIMVSGCTLKELFPEALT